MSMIYNQAQYKKVLTISKFVPRGHTFLRACCSRALSVPVPDSSVLRPGPSGAAKILQPDSKTDEVCVK